MSGVRELGRAIGLPALGGLAVWVIVAVVAWRTDAESLDLVAVLLLAIQLVAVPMGLALLATPRDPPVAGALVRLGRAGMRVGAVAALASLALPRGELSAAVAALYLLPALFVGAGVVLGARRLPLATVLAGVALGAGAWLFVLHRQDVAFTWLPELDLRIAAVHVHAVGFALVAMAGVVASRGIRGAGHAAAFALGAGTALTPFAGLLEPWIRVVGAILVATGVLALGFGTIVLLSDERLPAAGRRLIFVSLALSIYVAGAVLIGVIVAAVGGPAVDIGSTVRLHGSFGAIGVVVIGLTGWRLVQLERR
jgi:hypothetical protein